jgi:hypothetical protein
MVFPFRRLHSSWKSRKNASCGLPQFDLPLPFCTFLHAMCIIIAFFLIKSNLCFAIQFAPYQRILASYPVYLPHLFRIATSRFMNDQRRKDIKTNSLGFYRFDQHERSWFVRKGMHTPKALWFQPSLAQ